MKANKIKRLTTYESNLLTVVSDLAKTKSEVTHLGLFLVEADLDQLCPMTVSDGQLVP